jgi:hypothetical protein
VGNYDYLVDYIFMQDGTINFAVGSTGYVNGNCIFLLLFIENDCAFINAHISPLNSMHSTKGAASKSMSDGGAIEETKYGT